MNRCFSLLGILLIVSCSGNRQFRVILNQAESCMSASPDSSLALVNGIDGESLPTRKLRARHALLKTMAQDKCYIDVADDSLIQLAVNYYQDRKDPTYKMLSFYSLGRVQRNAKNNTGAIGRTTIMTLHGRIIKNHLMLSFLWEIVSMLHIPPLERLNPKWRWDSMMWRIHC